jgi:predicted DNA-binding transcriptional regulator AlpA
MSDEDLVRAVGKPEAIKRSGLSVRTWERLEAIGDTPPKVRLSEGRIGYLLSDIKDWLERRRESVVVDIRKGTGGAS